MTITATAITVVTAATAVASVCSADTGAAETNFAPSAPLHVVVNSAVPPRQPTIAQPRAADPTGHAVAGRAAQPPDAEGNPACPAFDSWGPSGGHTGIVVAYWGHGTDYVTVLVRTTAGPDVARSVTVEPGQALQLFEFPDAGAAVVNEVLVMSNESRCYATADPTLTGR
jgi:hypothetical protein